MMPFAPRFRRPFVAAAILLFTSSTAWSHSMLQTAVLLDLHRANVGVELQLPLDRLSISFRQKVDADHFAAEKDALRTYVLDHVHPTDLAGQPFRVQYDSMDIQTVENAPYLVVHLTFTPPKKDESENFILNYDVIAHEIVTHVVLVSIRSDNMHPVDPNDPILVGMIRGDRKSLVVDRFKNLPRKN